MKKYLIITAILFLNFLNAEDIGEFKIWKFFRVSEKSILITDDLEVWELNYLSPNKQTWAEWISLTPAELVGNEYIYQNKLWNEGSSILCSYYPWINSYESKLYRNDTSDLSLCSHILENRETKEKAFARPIDSKDWEKIYESYKNRYCVQVELASPEVVGLQKQELELTKFIIDLAAPVLNLSEDEYTKYLNFERVFSFVSIMLSVDKHCPAHLKPLTWLSCANEEFQILYTESIAPNL